MIDDGSFRFSYKSYVSPISNEKALYGRCIVSRSDSEYRVSWSDAQIKNTLRAGSYLMNEFQFFYPIACEKKSEIRYGRDDLTNVRNVNIYVHPGEFQVEDCKTLGIKVPVTNAQADDPVKTAVQNIRLRVERGESLPVDSTNFVSTARLQVPPGKEQRGGTIEVYFTSFLDVNTSNLPIRWNGGNGDFRYKFDYMFFGDGEQSNQKKPLNENEYIVFKPKSKFLQAALFVSGYLQSHVPVSKSSGTVEFSLGRNVHPTIRGIFGLPEYLSPFDSTLVITEFSMLRNGEEIGTFRVSYFGQ